eukprot:s952_g9.t1
MADANELLLEAKRAVGQLKAEDAAAPAEKALQIFRDLSDQVGLAEALRLLLLAQMERGEVRPEDALKKVKEEAAKVKRSARDGRRAEAMMQFTQAAVHLAKAEPVKAVQLAAEAEIYFQREQDWPALAEVLEVVAPAHLQRGDGKKAGDAANLILDVAQKMKNSEVEARAWALVSVARFMAKTEDAAEAARKALDLYRQLRHRAGEAQTLIELAKGQLGLQDSLSALATAREALKVAKEAGLESQVGRAVEAIVEAQLQAGHADKALEEAEEQLKSAPSGSNKGTASIMSAIVVATAALRGADAGLEKVKAFVDGPRLSSAGPDLDQQLVAGSVPRFCNDAAMAFGALGNLRGRWRTKSMLRKVLAVAVAVWATLVTLSTSLNFTGAAVSRWQVACPMGGRGSCSRIAMEAYSDMKVGELKALLKERGLKVGGLKAELVARLEESDAGDAEAEEVEEDDEAVEEEEEEEAPSPPPKKKAAPKTGPVEYKEGQLALAKFHDDGRYYSVKLKKDNGDGSFDIMWLEDEAEDTANLEDLKPQLKDFKKGDLVLAKCAEDGRRYTALVQENKGEGYITVQYIEDESEEEVLIDNVVKQVKKFKKGQKVEAKFPDDGDFYPATVKDDLGKGKYLIEWEDPDGSDPESEMLVDDIQKPRVNMDTFEVGQKLIGEVRRVVPFGAFVDVGAYTDGLVHVSKMANERVENPEDYVSEEDEITVWVSSIDTEQNRCLAATDGG